MINKRYILPLFIILCLAQLYIVTSIIFKKETIISNSPVFKFKTAPYDPTDPLRGKYISLQFEQNRISVKNPSSWSINETAYITIENDNEGFATIDQISKTPPDINEYLEVSITNIRSDELVVRLPFDRFYMNEAKAYDAELIYNERSSDSTSITYALISIYQGDGVLHDVLIDGVPIGNLVW